ARHPEGVQVLIDVRRRTSIASSWPDEFIGPIFLNGVRDPANRPAKRKEEDRCPIRQPVRSGDRGKREIQIRMLTQQVQSRRPELPNRPQCSWIPAGFY